MPGSLRERQPNVWELRVFLGRDDNGKVRHGNQTFRGGKRAAERELSRLVAAAENEPVPPPVVARHPAGTSAPRSTTPSRGGRTTDGRTSRRRPSGATRTCG